MVTRRYGKSSLGCLSGLLFLAVIIYFGVPVAEMYFSFYQYQDAMRQEVIFARKNSDAVILRRLKSKADSLGLPEAAGEVFLQREDRHIEIESDYYENIELPGHVREVHFKPRAEGSF